MNAELFDYTTQRRAAEINRQSAVLSADRKYRYVLWRNLGAGERDYVVFIGLNPSTADEEQDDPTIRRVKGFAKSWGYRWVAMLNLFAFRATKPADMFKELAPIGAENDYWLNKICTDAPLIIAALGTKGDHLGRASQVCRMFSMCCLRTTKEGHPEHPLYMPADRRFEAYARSK